jgi:hypothetical protein
MIATGDGTELNAGLYDFSAWFGRKQLEVGDMPSIEVNSH